MGERAGVGFALERDFVTTTHSRHGIFAYKSVIEYNENSCPFLLCTGRAPRDPRAYNIHRIIYDPRNRVTGLSDKKIDAPRP